MVMQAQPRTSNIMQISSRRSNMARKRQNKMYLSVLNGWMHAPSPDMVAVATEIRQPDRAWSEWVIGVLTDDKEKLRKCLRCHGASPSQAHRPPLPLWNEPVEEAEASPRSL
jgi:hypothetical protein